MTSRKLLAACVTLAIMTATAHATVVTADQQGWISQNDTSNGSSAGNNYLVGNCGSGEGNCGVGEFRDFFGFALPTITDPITSASLSIPTYLVVTNQSPSVTVAFTSSASPTTFAALGTGTVYASGTLSASDSDTILTLTLDAAVLSDIQASAGGEFFISSRVVSPTVFASDAPGQFAFGASDGSMGNPTLTFTAAPEPMSLAMLGTGLIGLNAVRRRKAT